MKNTFGNLSVGDCFIAFPTDGDNKGHGGFLGAYNVFRKIKPKTKFLAEQEWKDNCESVSNKTLSKLPDNFLVIKVQI